MDNSCTTQFYEDNRARSWGSQRCSKHTTQRLICDCLVDGHIEARPSRAALEAATHLPSSAPRPRLHEERRWGATHGAPGEESIRGVYQMLLTM